MPCRERGHPASAGQCRPGRDRQIPAAGGDGEAGGEEGADRGASSLLHLRLHAPARRGEQIIIMGGITEGLFFLCSMLQKSFVVPV